MNKITDANYTAVLLRKFRKRALQSRLRLVEADVKKKINISRRKHISHIANL